MSREKKRKEKKRKKATPEIVIKYIIAL